VPKNCKRRASFSPCGNASVRLPLMRPHALKSATVRRARMINSTYMLRGTTASTSFWRTLLTCGLCLLAFAFAVEAKTAWYGPAAGPGSAVRASKAMRADAPQVIEHGIPAPDPIHPQTSFTLLAVFATLLLTTETPTGREGARTRFRLTLATFSPQVFFRPPPFLS
jgi:hypothetical protein